MDSGDPGNQYCMTKHCSSYPQIVYCLRVSGVWNYPMDERVENDRVHHATRSHRGSWAHVRLPRTKHFQKHFPQKTHRHTHDWLGEEIRDWPYLKDLSVSWWISAQFFDAGEICELRLHTVTCLASLYVGKQHRTNNELQNCIKWPWIEPRLHMKSNNRRKFT